MQLAKITRIALLATIAGCVPPSTFARHAVTKIPSSRYRVVERDRRHQIVELELTAPTRLFSIDLPPGARVRVGPAGQAGPIGGDSYADYTAVTSPQAVTYHGVAFPAGTTLYFTEHRHTFSTTMAVRWEGAKLGGAARLAGLTVAAGDTIILAKGGQRPLRARFTRATAVGAQSVPAGADVYFNDIGEVKSVVTAEQRAAALREENRCRRRCAGYAGDPFAYCMNQCLGV